jgi:hypothetical protein
MPYRVIFVYRAWCLQTKHFSILQLGSENSIRYQAPDVTRHQVTSHFASLKRSLSDVRIQTRWSAGKRSWVLTCTNRTENKLDENAMNLNVSLSFARPVSLENLTSICYTIQVPQTYIKGQA